MREEFVFNINDTVDLEDLLRADYSVELENFALMYWRALNRPSSKECLSVASSKEIARAGYRYWWNEKGLHIPNHQADTFRHLIEPINEWTRNSPVFDPQMLVQPASIGFSGSSYTDPLMKTVIKYMVYVYAVDTI